MTDTLTKTLEDFHRDWEQAELVAKQVLLVATQDQFKVIVRDTGLSAASQERFLSGTEIRISSKNTIVIEIDPEDKLLEAQEEGASPYSIKDKVLSSSSKVKISKDGHRYMVVPLDKKFIAAKNLPSQTSGEQDMQTKIRSTLAKIKPTLKFMSTNKKTNEYATVESFPGAGMLRTKVYKNKQSFTTKRPAIKTGYVLFRTMTDKPGTSEWIHPGFKGENLVGKLEKWIESNGTEIYEQTIYEFMKDYFKG